MPELPEVETVRMKLLPSLKGKTIKKVKALYSKYSFLEIINNETVLDINRKGKYLIFVLNNYYLISHLRMEGKYFIKEEKDKNKHDLLEFIFEDFILFYNDVRKFGVFYLFSKDTDIYNIYPLNEVGDEPFYIDKDKFYEKIHKSSIPIKGALLDQSIMSGLGNIYADEVLYRSYINPKRLAKDITKEESDSLVDSSIYILTKAIEKGGSTIKSFTSFNKEIGHFQLELKCHLKEGERCERCNNFIIKTRCVGRGTYYCPTCEPLDKNKKIYGITGSISSGKSTVLSYIKEFGYKTISSDEIYNNLFINSKEMKRELKKKLNVSSKEDIKELILPYKDKNKELMEITHKYVLKEIYKEIEESTEKIIFVEVPLLFEGGYEKLFNSIIDVFESDELTKKLLEKRGYTDIEINNFMLNQQTKYEKHEKSNYVLYNNGTLLDLKKNTKELLKKLEVKS